MDPNLLIGPGTGRQYDCTSLALLDRHLNRLSDSIRQAIRVGDLVVVRLYRIDQDYLIERRVWLTEVIGETA